MLDWLNKHWLQDTPRMKHVNTGWYRGEKIIWPNVVATPREVARDRRDHRGADVDLHARREGAQGRKAVGENPSKEQAGLAALKAKVLETIAEHEGWAAMMKGDAADAGRAWHEGSIQALGDVVAWIAEI